MDVQRTIRRNISCVGIGLHSGNKVQLTLKPAPLISASVPANRPRRSRSAGDRPPSAGIQLATALSRNEVSVETVEHLLAAWSAWDRQRSHRIEFA
jgi:UDP-3-O-[3-hydroxymyristoyl] N-acetylglucosamine deacetylase